jgi:hypothetical protein
VNDALDAAVSHMESVGNLQPGQTHLMELDDQSLDRIGTFYGIQKNWPGFCLPVSVL